MEKEELNEILEKHRKWLNNEDGGKRADLRSANLYGANLYGAYLRGAYLSDAYLRSADLSGADLRSANLRSANLSGADLYGADLRGADLYGADLYGANLYGANLDESEKIRLGVCLEESIIGYKKCENGVIVTLKIPEGAIVFSINKSKCRTNMAKVIDIDGGLEQAVSRNDRKFIYRKGEMVYPDKFDCRYNVECGGGIHFFRTRKEAEEYI